MQPLDKGPRNQLENTVVEARELAETAANAALEELGVGEPAPYPHLSDGQRDLRRRLRLHGRQLGDRLNGGKAQSMDRLVEEIAYEHWHRMLFARFLAENDLLMYPDPDGPVPVTLQDCDDLAPDEGAANGWELAARYATQMLPQIFRVDSPVFELKLPTNFQRPLERLLADLPAEVFTASDALGWVYQFWQTNNKQRINDSEVKIGARELPAVTQLFTEPYMVSFLLDNALGAWWAIRRLSEEDLRNAASEEELRQKAAIPGVPLDYLRFVREADEDGVERWTPAAGTFPDWPEQLGELKTLDPCCGSGHFLVSMLLMLAPMRMEMEGFNAREAVDAVLRDNLHGLELDQRCVELAAFALALTAWRYPGAGGYRKLPEIQVACSGLSVSVGKTEWQQLALGKRNLSIALGWLHDTFRDAPVLGSLLNPAKTEAAKVVEWTELSTALDQALKQESGDEQHEVAVVAHGLAKAAILLAGQYHWVVTNVPFLTQIKFSSALDAYLSRYFRRYKANLATAVVARIGQLLHSHGAAGFVAPQSWWFLKRYENLRLDVLTRNEIKLLARLGENAFESPESNGEQVGLTIISQEEPSSRSCISLVDASGKTLREDKQQCLKSSGLTRVLQGLQTENENTAILFSEATGFPSLGRVASAYFGSSAGDRFRFVKCFWEVRCSNHSKWEYLQSSPSGFEHYSGLQECILWEKEKGSMFRLAESVKHLNHKAQQWRSGRSNWAKHGAAVSLMSPFPSSIYFGHIYDTNCTAVVPNEPGSVAEIVSLTQSADFTSLIKLLNQNRKVEVKTVLAIPYDQEKWAFEGRQEFPNGLPLCYSNNPTQSIFHGHPCGSVVWDQGRKWTVHGSFRTDETVLQVAVARLLGYRWPAEVETEMELAVEQREWVERCKALLPYADDDGIVCIPPVRGEATAADRLLGLLAAAYGEQWSNEVLAKLLSGAGHAGKTLESWLREKFFAQHCKLFQNRPFIWHVWDGLRDGFSVLLNYHKLDHKNLETLIYTYLGDWISRQKQDIKNGIDGAQEKLAAAEVLKERLELILEGEQPYDIFVRWKPLAEQPVGWNPDLNDGVRLNIRPFMTVPDVKKKGAGVLRDKPNIHWKKDRGKDVESAPWFYEFGGERINDHHLSLAEKRAAREQADNAS